MDNNRPCDAKLAWRYVWLFQRSNGATGHIACLFNAKERTFWRVVWIWSQTVLCLFRYENSIDAIDCVDHHAADRWRYTSFKVNNMARPLTDDLIARIGMNLYRNCIAHCSWRIKDCRFLAKRFATLWHNYVVVVSPSFCSSTTMQSGTTLCMESVGLVWVSE